MGRFRGVGWLGAGGWCVVVGCGGSTANDAAGAGTQGSTSTSTTSNGAHIPNPQEAELLAPLWIDEATLLAASGPELVELVQSIGLARGYAVCRCYLSPSALTGDIETWMDCANKQSGTFLVSGPDRARCVNQLMPQVPGLEAYLRCLAGQVQIDAFGRLESCEDIEANFEDPAPSPTCQTPPEYDWLREECGDPHFCPDGTRVKSGRCNGPVDCPDRSDEFSCFDDAGQDQVICGGTPQSPVLFCASDCGLSGEVVTCSADDSFGFACNDGTQFSYALLCDRKSDCSEGEDESSCLR